MITTRRLCDHCIASAVIAHGRGMHQPPCCPAQVSLQSPKVNLAGRGGDGSQVPGQDGAAVRTFRVLYLDEVCTAPAHARQVTTEMLPAQCGT